MNLVQIERTMAIDQLLENVLAKTNDRNSTTYKRIENALQSKDNKYISASLVFDAYQLSDKEKYFHEILSGGDLFVPAYVPPERNPELAERIERLKAEQANREYEEMTRNVSLNRPRRNQQADSFVPDMKSVQGQIITVVNVFLTIGGAFLFGYKSIEYSYESVDFTLQISFGLFCALLVAIADLYFLFKRLNKLE